MGLNAALTVDDLKARARQRVPRMFFEYADGGSWTESTYRANEADFGGITFRQRVAVDLERRSLASTMLGQPTSMPVGIAPAAIGGLQVADGEIKAALAAEKAGARGTFVGRPVLYGLGAGGEAGVKRVLDIMRGEMDTTMALMGERDVRDIGRHDIYSNELQRRQGY